jgi:hypothetical protein
LRDSIIFWDQLISGLREFHLLSRDLPAVSTDEYAMMVQSMVFREEADMFQPMVQGELRGGNRALA